MLYRTAAIFAVALISVLAVTVVQAAGLSDPASLNEKAPDVYKVKFDTSKGPFVVEVHRDWAPNGADRFYNLVKNGFFDNDRFFRVVDGFMVQFGINGNPKLSQCVARRQHQGRSGDAEQQARHDHLRHRRAEHAHTQVFINFNNNVGLDGQGFSPFGQVVSGMKVVDSLYNGYGEGAPRGSGPDQGRVQSEGNAYLNKDFPMLDYIKKATIEP